MVQSIIFDMDGTLFQTDKILESALEQTFTHLSALDKWEGPAPIEKYREIMGAPLPEVWRALIPTQSNALREQINAYFQERLIEIIQQGKGALYPNAEKILKYLHAHGFSIFIASNGLTPYLKAIVEYYHLENWVSETFSIDSIHTLNKSDLVRSIMKKHGITQAAMVGDRLSDIKAAKDNSLIAIGCSFDFAKTEELIQADFIIQDLMEIQKILANLAKTP